MSDTSFELFEKAVMDKILFGEDSNLAILREQYKDASVIQREFTGVGFVLFITGGVINAL